MAETAKRPKEQDGERESSIRRSSDTESEAPHSGTTRDSAHLRELRRLGGSADRGETVDTTGMTDEEFLAALLGR